MGEVVAFSGETCVEIPAAEALEKAKAWGLDKVVIIGADADGKLIAGGNFSEVATTNLLIDGLKHQLIRDRFGR